MTWFALGYLLGDDKPTDPVAFLAILGVLVGGVVLWRFRNWKLYL